MAEHDPSLKSHPYHLVDPSPWPLAGSFSLLLLTLGGAMSMHGVVIGHALLAAGVLGVLTVMFCWWRDVLREGRFDAAHTGAVQQGLRIGMVLFILSEVMFFAAFFWAYFNASLFPKLPLEDVWPAVDAGMWPPKGITPLETWDLPFMNTLILLLSGTTVTWAHYALLQGDNDGVAKGLGATVLLGATFTALQAFEYHHAAFGFKEGVFASTFYMATGFHGMHVLIGTIFLAVNWVARHARHAHTKAPSGL